MNNPDNNSFFPMLIGKTIQNGENPNSRGSVVVETGPDFHPYKTFLTIELIPRKLVWDEKSKKEMAQTVKVCVHSVPANKEGTRFKKVDKEGYIVVVD